jgi:hypothetical protein
MNVLLRASAGLRVCMLAFVGIASSAAVSATKYDLFSSNADVTVYGALGGHKLCALLMNRDIAGDGVPDLVFYSQGASPLGRPGVGLITTRNVQPSLPPTIDLASIGNGMRYIVPPAENYGPLTCVAVGDFNNDGYGDVAISSPCRGSNCDGTVFIVPGGVGYPGVLDLQNTAWPVVRIAGVLGSEGYLGYALAVGDVNDDGIDDLVASAPTYYYGDPQIGAIIYVIWGSAALPPIVDLSTSTSVLRIVDDEPGWATGTTLACGDVNGDRMDDILIGAPGDLPTKVHGKAVLVYGGDDLPSMLLLNTSSDGVVRIRSDESQPAGLGNAVALADVNRDLYDDLVIAADGASFGPLASCGVVYVFPGGSQVPAVIDVVAPPADATTIVGVDNNDLFGWSLAATDVTGDGFADIIASSDPLAADTSVVSIVPGSSSEGDTLFVESSSVERYCGNAVGSFGNYLQTGDFNQDGVSDLVIAEHRSNGVHCCTSGELHVVLGTILTKVFPVAGAVHLSSYPNPFTHETVIAFESVGLDRRDLSIYDVAGRLVRDFPVTSVEGGTVTIRWDGRAADGHPVPSGVYFARLTHAAGVASKKLLLIR